MKPRIGLVCSTGGHLAQLHWLKPWWSLHDRFWITFDKPDARALLAGEEVYWAHHPTTRNAPNLLRNLALAGRILPRARADLLVTDGAAVAIPFFAVGKALGIPLVYLEVYDRIDTPSNSGRVLRHLVDKVVLQWPEQRKHYPDGVLLGPVR